MSQPESPPVVPMAPAPWQLQGQGYILALRLPADLLDNGSFLDPSAAVQRRGRMAYVMFVDYATSDVGPYHELLFIPGSLPFSDGRHPSISKIYVSSQASVVNGQANWGIPKKLCEFDVRYGADGIDCVRLSLDGQVFAELDFSHHLFRLPFNGRLLPARLRTLGQYWQGREFIYAPAASGHIKPARLRRVRIDPAHFPDLAQGRVLACVKVTDFAMQFPVAKVQPVKA